MHCVVYRIQDGTMLAVNAGLVPASDYGTSQTFKR